MQLDLSYLSVVVTSVNDSVLWELHMNPTINNAFVYAELPYSGTEVATGVANNILATNGTILMSGHVRSGDNIVLPPNLADKLGSFIDGTPDELVLVVQPIVNSTDVICALNWRELL
jgi:hypothetical protein